MAGLVPAIHAVTLRLAFRTPTKCWQERHDDLVQHSCLLDRVDGRDKPGHDGEGAFETNLAPQNAMSAPVGGDARSLKTSDGLAETGFR